MEATVVSSNTNGALPSSGEEIGSVARQEPICVFIVCEVGAYRDALSRELGRDEGINVIGRTGPVDEVETIRAADPELIMVDAAEVVARAPARVVGYLPSAASLEQVIEAVKTAAQDDATDLLSKATAVPSPARAPDSNGLTKRHQDELTARETEVVRLIDRGLSNKEIGQLLCIEVATVKSHVHSILQKLSLRRRSQVAGWLRARNGTSAAA
jgi:DNA-binding CsgD family transcriptional regulator